MADIELVIKISEKQYEHAKMCGQLAAKIIYEREKIGSLNLISEDLW